MVLDFTESNPDNRVDKDLSYTIMRERVEWGIELMKKLAKENGLTFDNELMKKGAEVGISLFLSKERSYQKSK